MIKYEKISDSISDMEVLSTSLDMSGPLNNGSCTDVETITVSKSHKVHHFYIDGEISTEAGWYLPLIKLLNKTDTPKADKVYIHLNSPGGSVHAMLQLAKCLERTKIELHLIVDGLCASAATVLTCLPVYKSVVIGELTTVLFHDMSTMAMGKLSDINMKVEHTNKLFKGICDLYYKDILDTSEMKQISKGTELFMLGDELNKRIVKRNILLDHEKKHK